MEGIQRILLFITLVLTIVVSSSKADVQKRDPYPATNCFKNVHPLNKGPNPIEDIIDGCEELPEDSFCFKVCMLRKNLIINTKEIPPQNDTLTGQESEETRRKNNAKIQAYNHTADIESIINGILRWYYGLNYAGIIELADDEKFLEVFSGMFIQAIKCETISVVVPNKEFLCRNFSPESTEKMKPLINCIEDVLRCEE